MTPITTMGKGDLVRKNLRILDTFRGLAAVYVLIGHARWLLWEGYNEGYLRHPGAYSLVNRLCMYFFGLFKFGHQAVIFFFVLSGFVIHWSTSRQVDKQEGRFNIGIYLLKRLRRLYPPLIAAICLVVLLEWLGKGMQFPIYFGNNAHYPLISKNIQGNATWSVVLGNLTFVQGVYAPFLGTDGPLWSLMYEWWFYVLYIPVFYVFRKSREATCLLLFLLWIVNAKWGISPLLFTVVFKYFLSWFAGMLLADCLLYATRDRRTLFFGFLAVFLGGSVFFRGQDFGLDSLAAVFIAILFYFVLTTNLFAPLRRLGSGGFSYTLYVIHFPILCFISGYIMKKNDGILPMHFWYVIAGISLSVLVAWLLHFVVEKPFVSGKKEKEGKGESALVPNKGLPLEIKPV